MESKPEDQDILIKQYSRFTSKDSINGEIFPGLPNLREEDMYFPNSRGILSSEARNTLGLFDLVPVEDMDDYDDGT